MYRIQCTLYLNSACRSVPASRDRPGNMISARNPVLAVAPRMASSFPNSVKRNPSAPLPLVNVMDESGLWAWRVHVFQCLSFLLFFTSSSLHHFSIIKLCFSVYYYHPPCRTKRTLRILRERLTSSQVRIPFCGVFHPVSNKGRLRWHNLHARHRPRPSLQPRRR